MSDSETGQYGDEIELWIDGDSWALETTEGETIASGRTTDYQDRIPIGTILRGYGYEIQSVDTDTDRFGGSQ